jgi:hypothetical protein
MIQDIINPIKLIDKAKKTKNTQKQIITLIITSLIMSIATAIIMSKTVMATDILTISLTMLISFFAYSIISAYIYSFIIKLMTKKGTFYDSLTAITTSSIPLSAGLILTSIVLLLPNIGYLLGLITLFATIIISMAIFIRAITTLTNATITDIVVATIIMSVGLIIAMQLILSIQMITNPLTIDTMQQLSNNLSGMTGMQ